MERKMFISYLILIIGLAWPSSLKASEPDKSYSNLIVLGATEANQIDSDIGQNFVNSDYRESNRIVPDSTGSYRMELYERFDPGLHLTDSKTIIDNSISSNSTESKVSDSHEPEIIASNATTSDAYHVSEIDSKTLEVTLSTIIESTPSTIIESTASTIEMSSSIPDVNVVQMLNVTQQRNVTRAARRRRLRAMSSRRQDFIRRRLRQIRLRGDYEGKIRVTDGRAAFEGTCSCFLKYTN